MEILNRFVDWKKNIRPIAYYGIGAYFDINVTSFEEVKGQIFSNFNLVPDLKLKKYLLLGDISFEKSKYGYGYECMQDFDMKNPPPSTYGFSLSQNHVPTRNISRISCRFWMNAINHDLLVMLSRIKGLTLMIVYNPKYRSWENNDRPEAYRYKGGIKTYFSETHKIEKVDLSDRPGRMTGIGKITYHGGSEYWFGPSFYELVPKEQILAFEHADLVEELPGDIVHIKLMDLKDYWSNESQGRLIDLRYHLEIDRLEKEYLASLEH